MTSNWGDCAGFGAASEGAGRHRDRRYHGEGPGDHGESLHGNLYQATMHVPVLSARGILTAERHAGGHTKGFHTVLDWAGLGNEIAFGAEQEIVLPRPWPFSRSGSRR
jgi:hypothetical protein